MTAGRRGAFLAAETQKAGLKDGIFRFHAILSLRCQSEINHHNRVLLHDSNEQDNADQRNNAEIFPADNESEQGARCRLGQRGDRVRDARGGEAGAPFQGLGDQLAFASWEVVLQRTPGSLGAGDHVSHARVGDPALAYGLHCRIDDPLPRSPFGHLAHIFGMTVGMTP